MPKLHETKLLKYSHKQLFDLVMDVESYPKFLPFCARSKVIRSGEQINAELTIKFSLFTESYKSIITPYFTNEKAKIEVVAEPGIFKRLINIWQFTPTEDGTMVDFDLDFEFKSALLEKMMGAMISKAFNKMMAAFEDRANEIYKE